MFSAKWASRFGSEWSRQPNRYNVADTKQDVKLTSWPSPQDYNEAIQNLLANTQDPQLQKGHVHTNALGLPRSISGAFASVYRVHCGDVKVAVRCFLRDIRDQEQRYKHISDFVQHDDLPYTVTFDFLAKGIRVGPGWFPALKMDWVEGHNLDLYLEKHLSSPSKIAQLAESFRIMCDDLQKAGIAHGDLQHGNIIVCGEELRLVDYDGMYVPAMKGMRSNEIGHRNYQHPARGAYDFGPHLDNFSAWVIYASLRCLAVDPRLWHQVGAGDDCLLFRRDDFVEPEYSYTFALLEHHPNEEVKALARFLRWQSHSPVADVPPLSATIPMPPALPALPSALEHSRRAPRSSPVRQEEQGAGLPDWIDPQTVAGTVIGARPRPKAPPARGQANVHLPAGIEPELAQSLPRYILFNENKGTRPDILQWMMLFNPALYFMIWSFMQSTGFAVGLMCVAFLVTCEFFIWNKPTRDKALLRNGECVLTRNISTSEHTDSEGSKIYTLVYTFVTKSGKTCEVKRTIGYDEYKFWKQKKFATVIYDAWEPQYINELYERMSYKAVNPVIPQGIEAQLATYGPRKTAFRTDRYVDPVAMTFVSLLSPAFWLMFSGGAVGIVCAMVTAWVTWMIWSEPIKEFQLCRDGIPARGIIKTVKLPPPDSAGMGIVQYQFQSPTGIVQGHASVSDSQCAQFRSGDIVTILYDLSKPDRNVIYSLSRYSAT
jgi:hypothetical protein